MRTIGLPEDHGWRARDGFSIVVADRGAVRFDIPTGWVTAFGGDCDMHVSDAEPPDDEYSLKLTVLRLPVPVTDLPPLDAMVAGVAAPSRVGGATDLVGPVCQDGARAELAWVQWRFTEGGREAIQRTLVGRGGGVHALFTSTLWAADEERFEPAWVELRRSLEVGVAYDLSGRDPRRN